MSVQQGNQWQIQVPVANPKGGGGGGLGAPTYDLANFHWKLHENETIWAGSWRYIPFAPKFGHCKNQELEDGGWLREAGFGD